MSNLDIYTLKIKRIALAIQNLVDGFADLERFKTEHDIDKTISDAVALDSKAVLVADFVKEDFDSFYALKAEIENIKTINKLLIEKYGNWDQKELIDPLDMLGKVFYQFGDPIREQI